MTLKALAPAPTRATTTITLSLGMMTLPLSVYTGVEETRVVRKEFYQGDVNVPVGRGYIRKDTGEIIDVTDVVRMAQADNGLFVSLSDDEIAASTTDRGLATVPCFVPNTKVSQYLVQDVKQVRPKREKGKANPAYERAFALLLAGLKARKVHALVTVAMRGPARYALLDCEGNLFLVASADQVRASFGSDVDSYRFTKDEVDLMGTLIDAVGIDAPVITDTTAPAVQAFVNAKAKGVQPVAATTPPPANHDLMSQLEASIAAAKKAKEAA